MYQNMYLKFYLSYIGTLCDQACTLFRHLGLNLHARTSELHAEKRYLRGEVMHSY